MRSVMCQQNKFILAVLTFIKGTNLKTCNNLKANAIAIKLKLAFFLYLATFMM